MKIQGFGTFSSFFLCKRMILGWFCCFFKWFFDDFWRLCFKEKIKQNQGNHQKIINTLSKIILLLEKIKNACQKQWKSKLLAPFLLFSWKGWFLDDFWCFFDVFWWFLKALLQRESSKTKEIIKQISKIILLLEKIKNACQKQWKSKVLARFLWFFS